MSHHTTSLQPCISSKEQQQSTFIHVNNISWKSLQEVFGQNKPDLLYCKTKIMYHVENTISCIKITIKGPN